MVKEIKSREEYYIELSDDELAKFNLNKDERYEWVLQDGGVMLKPLEKVELELNDFDRTVLEYWIKESVEKNITVNDVIVRDLKKALKEYED
jgi:hypothetical protein